MASRSGSSIALMSGGTAQVAHAQDSSKPNAVEGRMKFLMVWMITRERSQCKTIAAEGFCRPLYLENTDAERLRLGMPRDDLQRGNQLVASLSRVNNAIHPATPRGVTDIHLPLVVAFDFVVQGGHFSRIHGVPLSFQAF